MEVWKNLDINDLNGEIWEVIEDFPDYSVSSLGRVKRITKGRHTKVGKILKQYLSGWEYLYIRLYKNGKQFHKEIHILVLENFISKKYYNKLQGNHKNGIKTDNKSENLEWVTIKENIKHSYNIGLSSNHGEKNSNHKLTEKKIIQIKMLFKLGFRNIEISKLYNVKPKTISDIRMERNWSYIKI